MEISLIDHDDFDVDAELFKQERFSKLVAEGEITSDSGIGYWATCTQTSNLQLVPKPGMLESQRPSWATHVMWHNK